MKAWNLAHQQYISRQIEQDKLPHALLICGAKGSGKEELARWIIDVFNCLKPITIEQRLMPCKQCKTCLLSLGHTNPDTTEALSTERSISVDEIRRVSHFLETKPQIANGKSVFIAHAQKMTISAANALLKTLEEPNNNCLLVLYCEDVDTVLPTILSRCQLINIRPYVGDELVALLNVNTDDPYLNINYFEELTDPTIKNAYVEFSKALADTASNSRVSEQFFEIITSNELGIDWLERVLVNLIRKQNNWLVAKHIIEIEEKWSINTLWQLYQLVIEAKKKLKLLMQANPAFIKEQLLADIEACIAKSEVLN